MTHSIRIAVVIALLVGALAGLAVGQITKASSDSQGYYGRETVRYLKQIESELEKITTNTGALCKETKAYFCKE